MSDTTFRSPTPLETDSSDAAIQRAWDRFAMSVDAREPLGNAGVGEGTAGYGAVIHARLARDQVGVPAPVPARPRLVRESVFARR